MIFEREEEMSRAEESEELREVGRSKKKNKRGTVLGKKKKEKTSQVAVTTVPS